MLKRPLLSDLATLTSLGDGRFQTPSGYVLMMEKKLAGRGQKGFAGFLRLENTNYRFLVKSDPEEICVLEGTASFVSEVMPSGYENSVNFAMVGKIVRAKDAVEISVTVQHALDNYRPWDVLIYGEKRDPNQFVSVESKNETAILDNIQSMTDNAQTQLAVAIYASSFIGDESQHTGQFMAEVDGDEYITGIVRVDLGARERYAVTRILKEDVGLAASKSYQQAFGQKGKNYQDFLLKHPMIYAKYLRLWARDLPHAKTIIKRCRAEFILGLNHLPKASEDSMKENLKKVYKILSKESPLKLSSESETDLCKRVVDQLEFSLSNRMATLSKEATTIIADLFAINTVVLGITEPESQHIEEIINQAECDPVKIQRILALFKHILSSLSPELDITGIKNLLHHGNAINTLLCHMLAALECRLWVPNKDPQHDKVTAEINRIRTFKLRIDIIRELSEYVSYFHTSLSSIINAAARLFSDKDDTLEFKIAAAKTAIRLLKNSDASLSEVCHDQFFRMISTRRINGDVESEGEKLATIIRRHIQKHNAYNREEAAAAFSHEKLIGSFVMVAK